MHTFLIALIAGHGLVHVIGFLRAFGLMKDKGYEMPVSKPYGFAWLVTFLLFEGVAVMVFYDLKHWWIYGSIAVVISQLLIIRYWDDTKFGTLVNIVILFIIVVDFGSWHWQV